MWDLRCPDACVCSRPFRPWYYLKIRRSIFIFFLLFSFFYPPKLCQVAGLRLAKMRFVLWRRIGTKLLWVNLSKWKMMLQTQLENLSRFCLWKLTACMLRMLICLLLENGHQQTVDEGQFRELNHVQQPQGSLCFSHEEASVNRLGGEAGEEFRLSELKPSVRNFCHR